MIVFISWSGNKSRYVAEGLRTWLKDVMQNIDPWVSSEDIRQGARWHIDIAKKLEEASFGILCLTRENINEPWLLFEAGALAKTLEKSHVCPFLIDLKYSDLHGPLVQFQAAIADEMNTRKLIFSINKANRETRLPEDQVDRAFKKWWPDFSRILHNIPEESFEFHDIRSDRDLLEEILIKVRQGSVVSHVNKTTHFRDFQPFEFQNIFIEGPDVLELLNKAELLGQKNDQNEKIWSKLHLQAEADALDGVWSSRWAGGMASNSWIFGIGNVHVYGENLYAITRDSVGDCLIVTKRYEGNLIAGRYFNISEPREVLPWAGRIVSYDRIDGYWSEGRWDLRRGIE